MKKIIGIYCIENLINGKKYIGQSINIYKRWRHYRYSSKKNKYYPIYMAIRKYGIENFGFYILKECNKELLNNCEKFYIKFFMTQDYKFGYNATTGGDSNYKKNKPNKETIEKMRNARKNQKMSPLTIKKIQIANSCKKRNWASSKYHGVHYDKKIKKWIAQLTHKDTRKYIGAFCTEVSAAMAYNLYIIKKSINGYKLNNLSEKEIELNKLKEKSIIGMEKYENSLKMKGVSFHKTSNRWRSAINYNKKQHILGYFLMKEEAAFVYNEKSKEIFGENAFINKIPDNINWDTIEKNKIKNKLKNKKKCTSRYFGVHFCKYKNLFVAKIGFEGKSYYLGSFKNELDAAIAYNNKSIEFYGEDAIINKIYSGEKEVAFDNNG